MRESRRHALESLTLPLGNHLLMLTMLRRQFGKRLLVRDLLQCNTRPELARIPLQRDFAHKSVFSHDWTCRGLVPDHGYLLSAVALMIHHRAC